MERCRPRGSAWVLDLCLCAEGKRQLIATFLRVPERHKSQGGAVHRLAPDMDAGDEIKKNCLRILQLMSTSESTPL